MATVPATPNTLVVSSAPTPVPSRRRKKRPTVQERINATNLARTLTGYNDTSPIWGKKLPEVLVEIEQRIDDGITLLGAGDGLAANDVLVEALQLNRELQKRTATYKVISAQLK